MKVSIFDWMLSAKEHDQVISPELQVQRQHALSLERVLLLTFLLVAGISIIWHLGSGIHWLWAACIGQLHSAVLQTTIG